MSEARASLAHFRVANLDNLQIFMLRVRDCFSAIPVQFPHRTMLTYSSILFLSGLAPESIFFKALRY